MRGAWLCFAVTGWRSELAPVPKAPHMSHGFLFCICSFAVFSASAPCVASREYSISRIALRPVWDGGYGRDPVGVGGVSTEHGGGTRLGEVTVTDVCDSLNPPFHI